MKQASGLSLRDSKLGLNSLSAKVMMGCGLMMSLLAGSSLVGGWVATEFANSSAESDRTSEMLRNHMEGDMMHDALRADVIAALLAAKTNDPAAGKAALADVAEHAQRFRETIEANDKLVRTRIEHDVLSGLRKPLGEYINAATTIVKKANTDPASAQAMLPAFQARFSALETAMEHASDQISDEVNAATKESADASTFSQQLMLGILALGLAVGVLMTMMGRRSIIKPLQGMKDSMDALAGGDTDLEIAGMEKRDEIGAMARAVGVFRDNAIAKIQSDMEVERQRKAAEEASEANQRAEREQQEKQRLVVEQLARGLASLAEGDLRNTLNDRFPSEYEKLRNDYNAAVMALRGVVSNISARSDKMLGAAQDVSGAASELSNRTENQAASLEETAAALDQITATVKRTSVGADEARKLVHGAQENTERSTEVLGKTVAAMTEIQESSRQIGQIINVIEEISFQTSLLALNAGVEAARAGEAGRGFAVVAQEVRALAQRAADAAKEIKTLIQTSSEHVSEGSRLVDQTSETLNGIVADVTRIRERVLEIADSAKEQATALSEVNTALNQMDQVTQRNAAMVQETTHNSQSLATEARGLADEVEKFRLPADGKAAGRRAA